MKIAKKNCVLNSFIDFIDFGVQSKLACSPHRILILQDPSPSKPSLWIERLTILGVIANVYQNEIN